MGGNHVLPPLMNALVTPELAKKAAHAHSSDLQHPLERTSFLDPDLFHDKLRPS